MRRILEEVSEVSGHQSGLKGRFFLSKNFAIASLVGMFLLALLFVPCAIKRFTGGFRLEKMHLELPYHPEWDTDGAGIEKAREILSQPYYYLDRGSQCYVFASEDGKYVIKLLRFDQEILLQRAFRGFFSGKKTKFFCDEKASRLLNASKLAYDRVPFETGLVFIHLNTKAEGLPILNCKDALGRAYRLPLDGYRFVLQKKAEPLRPFLSESRNDPEAMKRSLDSIFRLLQVRTAKGLHNSDSNLSRNLGFLDGMAIEIDFGNYCDCPDLSLSEQRIKEINRFFLPLKDWIKCQAPEWASYIDERMKELKEEIRTE